MMKKIYFAIVILLLTTAVSQAQNNWVSFSIDPRVSVKMPKQPQQIDANSNMASNIDTTVICITTLVDFRQTANLDSAALAPMIPTQDFADQIRTGMLSQMAGYDMGPVTIGRWHGYYTYTMQGSNVSQKLKVYTYMVVIGSYLYGLNAIVKDNKSPRDKDFFFSSLTLN